MTPSDAMDIAICRPCGAALTGANFATDALGRLVECCDNCARNRERARVGLPAITFFDTRPIPAPSKRDQVECEQERALEQAIATRSLADEYNAGDSTVTLGKRYGVRAQKVNKILARMGVPMRGENQYTPAFLRKAA